MSQYLVERQRILAGEHRNGSKLIERGRDAAALHQAGEAEAWARRRQMRAV